MSASSTSRPPRRRGGILGRLRQAPPVLLALGALLEGTSACEAPPGIAAVRIGLLLSYTGTMASSSVNSERALQMAIEAVNGAGGIGDLPLRLLARDTRSDPRTVTGPARELMDADVAALIGPDNTDLLSQLRASIGQPTLILPSLATASDIDVKPNNWFVMGAGLGEFVCQLQTQVKADGRSSPLVLSSPSPYNSGLTWTLVNNGVSKFVLPSDGLASGTDLQPLIGALHGADSYILAASPTAASRLIYGLTAVGELADPTRWYLSPTLHTPVFLESIPRGAFEGARGVAPGTVAGAADFRAAFATRWQDVPLDDAYSFYDAGAIAALAVQRALTRTGAVPHAEDLSLAEHIVAVTRPGGEPVSWSELGRGLRLLREGSEVEYFGVTGQVTFDDMGLSRKASTRWWKIADQSFVDVPRNAGCD
jgi:branched-chain amino acid transport system substrate-binding protein